MSTYSGTRLSFDLSSGQADGGNDCDCEVDGSFIIIPKHESVGAGSPSSPAAPSNPLADGRQSDSKVKKGAGSSSTASVRASRTFSVDPNSVEVADGDGGFSSPTSSKSKSQKGGDALGNESMQLSQLHLSVNSNISCVGSEPSSLEEANSMLNSLTVENQKLKLLLAERNENMKRSLDTYKNLQMSISAIHEDHKTKYEGSRALIEQLREENAKLKSELDLKEAQLMEYPCVSTNTELDKLQKVEKLQNELHSKQADLDRMNRQLEEQLKLVSEANLHREHLHDLLRKKELELVGTKSSAINMTAYNALQEERDTLHSAFEDSKLAIEELNKHRMKKDDEIKELTRVIKDLTKEIENLKEQLKIQAEEMANLKIDFTQKLEIIAELETKLQASNNLVQDIRQELEVRESDALNLRSLLEKERNSFAQLKETLTDKDKENSLLLTQMALLKSQEEQTELYKTQMEEYKTNFEEERRDRVSMKERKDELAEELTRLKLELENKTAELEALHRAHLQLAKDHVDRDSPATSSPASASAPPDSFVFVPTQNGGTPPSRQISEDAETTISPCPMCHKKFSTRNALLSHASHCGDVRGPFLFP